MGIRKKLFLGFVIIGFILFLSGCICIFQLVRIEKSVSGILTDNVKSIDITKRLSDAAEAQIWDVMHIMVNNATGRNAEIQLDTAVYEHYIDLASKNITSEAEDSIVENVRGCYESFKSSSRTLDSVFAMPGMSERARYFNTRYKPSLRAFIESVRELQEINREEISQNSRKLEGDFYRIVMPLIIAMGVGLFLVLIFNYFINLYFITPVLAIIKGIKSYLGQKTPYDVKIETKDEINELNHEIKVLISHSKKKDNNRPGVFEFGKNE